MKFFLLFCLTFFALSICKAQSSGLSQLPAGKYETTIKGQKWEKGDIILLDDSRYQLSTSNETGEYRFSISAQRVFFTSGPLKTVYAKTSLDVDKPAIVLPVAENQQSGISLPAEVRGKFRQ